MKIGPEKVRHGDFLCFWGGWVELSFYGQNFYWDPSVGHPLGLGSVGKGTRP